MSVYFSSKYKKYYDKLSSSNLSSANSSILNDISNLKNRTTKLNDQVLSSNWSELGKNEFSNVLLPNINNSTTAFVKNIENNLIRVSDIAYNSLLPLLKSLKEKDEEYDTIEAKMMASSDSSKNSYITKLNIIENEMKVLVRDIDSKLNEISSINGSKSVASAGYSNLKNGIISLYGNDKSLTKMASSKRPSISVKSKIQSISEEVLRRRNSDEIVASSGTIETKSKERKVITDYRSDFLNQSQSDIVEKLIKIKNGKVSKTNNSYGGTTVYEEDKTKNNSNLVSLTTLGENFKVVNTALDVNSYAQTAYSKGIRQDSNPARYGDMCLAFSYVHASNLYNGSTGDNAESAMAWKHAGEFKDFFSDDKSAIMTEIYNNITEGKPVILQVNGNSQGTARHFVTVVGFKDSVISASTLKDTDLLILDSWDGKLERMDTSSSRFMTTGTQTKKSYSGYYLRVLK